MKYREFGKTGIQMSSLGLGAMRMPTIGEDDDKRVDLEKTVPMIRLALENGVNYIDTAWGYLNQTSEIGVGEAIQGFDREKIFIATKNPPDAGVVEWRNRLDIQLERLKTDYIDFYHIHGLQYRDFKKKMVPEGHMKELEKARDQGLIRHISFSCHDSPKNLVKLIETGEFSSVLLQYNLLNRINATAIERAQEMGMGVVVMGPVGGGRLSFFSSLKPRENRTVPELALRFVLSNPAVNVVLSGMNALEMISENVQTAQNVGPLSTNEQEDIQHMMKQLQGLDDLYCTGCDYCMPCPHGVNIPVNFMFMNYERLDPTSEDSVYPTIYHNALKPAGASAEDCLECEECVEKCPQNIAIPDRLKDVVAHFAKRTPKPAN